MGYNWAKRKMKKTAIVIITLILSLFFYPLVLVGQAPMNKYNRALNTIVVLDAFGSLNVPLYLPERVNSSRIYSWYPTASSFGVRAKSSETPICSIECTYSNGKLNNVKQDSYTYTIEWNNDRIYRVLKYNSNGSLVKESRASGLVMNDEPVRFEHKLRTGGIDMPNSRMCLFKFVHEGGQAFTYMYWGQYYWISFVSHYDSSLEIEMRDFTIYKERRGTITKTPVYHDKVYATLISKSDGRCYYDSSKTYFNSSEYIEEIDIKY